MRFLAVLSRCFLKSIFLVFYLCSAVHAQELKQHLTANLSLDDAILLSVRENPSVQISKLNYLSQKFNLYVEEWQFYPHYSFQASSTFNRSGAAGAPITGSHHYNVTPQATLRTPIGTQVTLGSTNVETYNFNPGLSAQIMQPLMRGFGTAVVEAALNNAKDSEVIARLNIEGTLRNTVSSVINAYLDVITALRTMKIDEDALARAEKSVEQTKLFIKAGHKAGNELVTVEADVASSRAQVENDKNNLIRARYALLTAIGIDPNSAINFSSLNLDHLIKKYHLPTKTQATHAVLANDIQYQIDNITLHGSTQRNLLIAEDNTRWILNASANAATGSGSGGGQNAGINSLFNGANQAQSIELQLTIPIDDQLAKQSVVNAKVALKQAEISLLQEKWSRETSAINAWHDVVSAKRLLEYTRDAENLQLKTYNISYQKYLHGLIDSLELQSAQFQLTRAQQSSLIAEISYLKSLVNLDLLMGNTLKTWNIPMRGEVCV